VTVSEQEAMAGEFGPEIQKAPDKVSEQDPFFGAGLNLLFESQPKPAAQVETPAAFAGMQKELNTKNIYDTTQAGNMSSFASGKGFNNVIAAVNNPQGLAGVHAGQMAA